MTPETDENGSDDSQRAPAPAARGRKDTLWAGLATTVAVASMLWIAYQSNVRNEITLVQRQIEAQHAELQSLKDKIQGMTPTQSRTDVEQSQPSISEIQGLQNHLNTLRGQQNQRKK